MKTVVFVLRPLLLISQLLALLSCPQALHDQLFLLFVVRKKWKLDGTWERGFIFVLILIVSCARHSPLSWGNVASFPDKARGDGSGDKPGLPKPFNCKNESYNITWSSMGSKCLEISSCPFSVRVGSAPLPKTMLSFQCEGGVCPSSEDYVVFSVWGWGLPLFRRLCCLFSVRVGSAPLPKTMLCMFIKNCSAQTTIQPRFHYACR